MKAILILITFVSVSSFAGDFDMQHRQLLKAQQREECIRNPDYCKAMELYRTNIEQVKKLEAQVAKLERQKAFVCRPPAHYSDHGVLASIDTQFEYMKTCKASMRYTEETAKIDSRISQVNSSLEVAVENREQSKVLVSYLYAKRSSVDRK